MAWNALFVFVSGICVASSMEGYYQPPRGSSVWGYFSPPLLHREPPHTHQSPMEAMVDLTNNLGVAILQDNTFSRGNFAFSPYGVASVLVVLYEGARGESARQIHRAVGFPSDKDIIRVGFRDIHRHLRSYFSHEGYLSGISLNKQTSSLKPEYKRVLRFYGYDIDLGDIQDDEDDDMGLEKPSTAPTTEGGRNGTTVPTTTGSPGSTTSQVTIPDSADLVTENTTAAGSTVKEVNTTTVSTAAKEVNTTVSPMEPTEAVTEAGIKSTTSNDGVKTTQNTEPETATDESSVENTTPAESLAEPEKATEGSLAENTEPIESVTEPKTTEASLVENTKPTESVTEPEKATEGSPVENTLPAESVTQTEKTTEESSVENATEPDATTDKSPSEDTKPENAAVEQEAETTVETTTVNKQTTATERLGKEDMIVGITTSKPASSTTEAIKVTTTMNLTTESEKIATTTEPVKSQIELHTLSTESETDKITTTTEPQKPQTTLHTSATVPEVSTTTETPSGKENKEVSSTTVPKVSSTTDTLNSKRNKEVSSTILPKLSTTTETPNSEKNKEVSSTILPKLSTTTETPNCEENKEVSSTTVENTTENLKQDARVPDENTRQPQSSSTAKSKEEVTEAVAEAETTVKETTVGVSTEVFTNSPLDNGMLIPQTSDLVAAENETETPSTSASGFNEEGTSKKVERTTASHSRGADVLPETGRRSLGGNIISWKPLQPEEEKRIRNIVDTRAHMWLDDSFKSSKSSKFRRVRTITDYLKSPHNPDLSLQLQNGMYDTHVSRNADLYRSLPRLLFLVDGAIDTPVPMMTYTNVFPYTYIPKLHAKALEFPLDDVRYKLLILLPVERRGLRQLIYDLLDYPLSDVLAAMKPARVKAIVPTFMVEGFVILTSSLQKLGIWDVFDPRKANLSGMSMDPELYVRNVEQSVTVVIRNYVEILDIQTRTMAARYMEYEFEATHPFLYFVLDTSTNVALMAGQILDPLNSRIY